MVWSLTWILLYTNCRLIENRSLWYICSFFFRQGIAEWCMLGLWLCLICDLSLFLTCDLTLFYYTCMLICDPSLSDYTWVLTWYSSQFDCTLVHIYLWPLTISLYLVTDLWSLKVLIGYWPVPVWICLVIDLWPLPVYLVYSVCKKSMR